MSNTDKETIRNRVKKARQTSYNLMGAGMHGLNGTGPAVAMIQYTTYVLPTLLYGLEALVLDADDIQPLENFTANAFVTSNTCPNRLQTVLSTSYLELSP